VFNPQRMVAVVSISELMFWCVYWVSSLGILEPWKTYAHVVCDPEGDPHSVMAYLVVLIFGPLMAVLATLHKLAEYLVGRRDDR